MAHIFTGGLTEKIKKTEAEAPEELVEAIKNLRTYPSSTRVCREAIALADSILREEVRPLRFITKRAVVSFGKGNSQICVEYRRGKTLPLSLNYGYDFSDSYSFYTIDKGNAEEICINRDGGFSLFQYIGKRHDKKNKISTITLDIDPSIDSMQPTGVEILRNEQLVENYPLSI